MDQKKLFIADYLRRRSSMAELCDRYNISRKTGYKVVGRFEEFGYPGLEDRSSRPLSSPNQTAPEIVAELVRLRKRHPSWGAKKLLKVLGRARPDVDWPKRATACDILKREGLVRRKRQRRKVGHPGKPTLQATEPNHIWAVDFKGEFKTTDGLYCYPLTVTDNFSRYLFGCQALASTSFKLTKPVFVRLFREYGLPELIRSDNGTPFASVSLARLSSLSAWWIRLGILPQLIEPGRPSQNGRHERMHRTLKAETTRPPAANLAAQQRKFNRWREEFNHDRPHEAIDLETPATVHTPSPRPFPEKLAPIEYPDHFEKRFVSKNSGIRWNSRWVNISSTIAGEYVGLEEIDNGVWLIYFGPVKLGILHENTMKVEDAFGHFNRKKRV
jgi:transposase InsO family protein